MSDQSQDERWMSSALELAARGRGFVEPNPMVGCVVVADGQVVGEGWHQKFGGAHAEVEALRAAGKQAGGGTMYVTLEPCCHHGKTPPCADAVIQAGLARVVVAMGDPFAKVDGGGIARLREAGIQVDLGILEAEARRLNAPYRKLVETGRPWLIAKWAMTLDGKIATRSGDSQWISGEASRQIVHQLRGRVDAIVVGRKTAERDDPLLTARPAGPRIANRIVVDSAAALSNDSQLARTASDVPVIVAVGASASVKNKRKLEDVGCEVLFCPGESHEQRWAELAAELGRRRMTNVLVEGGAELLGGLLAAGQIDEAHIFIAPKLIGGREAVSAIGGIGVERIADSWRLTETQVEQLDGDVYIRGRVVAAQ